MCTYNILICLFVQGNFKERETEKGSVYGTSSMCINESNPIMHCEQFSEKSAQDSRETEINYYKNSAPVC